MEKIKNFLKKDRYAKHSGIELLDVSKGTAKAVMAIREEHLNGVGIAHGGAIFTLADFVFAAASNSHGTVAVAINANISYVKAATGGTLTAQAKEVSLNPKIATYSVRVTDETGDLVASFQGMVYRKKTEVPHE
ncbi:MAG: hotdog fold thioesterase [Phycisphaerae bacterium]|nr:hotdog fold thioesterase [Phycisphaerae bacterium]